jgi:DNA-binding IclR family transcriptional regulator
MKEIVVAKIVAATPRRSAGKRTVGTDDRDPTGVDVIAKVDAVLSILEERGETSAADIAELTGEPLSSVYRLLQSLTGVGWVDRGSRRAAYRLGVLLLEVGSRLEDQLDIREVALPTLRQLLNDIGVTAFLCVRRDARAVCVERLEGLSVRSLAMQLGSSLPLYAGAAPRALLAFLPVEEQQAALAVAELAGDPVRPASTAVADDIEQVRHLGYAISDGDVTPGIAALGAPVFDHRGELAAAVSISGLRSQVLGAQQERNVELLLAGASSIGRALGHKVPA